MHVTINERMLTAQYIKRRRDKRLPDGTTCTQNHSKHESI